MGEESKPPPLPYFRATPKAKKLPYDAEFLRWRTIRFLYRIGLYALIGPVAIYFFMNIVMFGKLTRLTPADFVPEAQIQCLPMVRAIKQYQKDTGQWPDGLQRLVPKYIASVPWGQDIEGTQFTQWIVERSKFNHVIIYEFTPAAEGWSVKGYFADGPIPLPKVTLGP